jgi:polyisoprenoid-binding protein YceI
MTIQSEAGVPTRSTWKLYPAHTLVEFSGKHMMFTTGKRARSSVEVEIDTPSLYSWVESRDTHLESPDFLGIERYLTITFKSTAWRS